MDIATVQYLMQGKTPDDVAGVTMGSALRVNFDSRRDQVTIVFDETSVPGVGLVRIRDAADTYDIHVFEYAYIESISFKNPPGDSLYV